MLVMDSTSFTRVPLKLARYVLFLLRSSSPQIIPLFVCLFLVPLVILLSLFAGWIVWNSVATAWDSPLDLQYGDGVPPYAYASLPPVVPKQRYDVALHLTVPATESNFVLGNFMTTLALATTSNTTLASARRPAIVLPPRGYLFTTPRFVNLQIPLLTAFVPGTSRLVARVEIGRRDGWTTLGSGHGRELSIVSASLRGEIVHHGIRGLVTRFPLLFAIASTISFSLILFAILGVCILPGILPRKPKALGELVKQEPEEATPMPSALSGSESDEKPVTRRRPRTARNSRRRTASLNAPQGIRGSQPTVVKMEDTVTAGGALGRSGGVRLGRLRGSGTRTH
ncbi:hypothetical protein BD779DRAFT_1486090, partial [Infundibulicybe gibba]